MNMPTPHSELQPTSWSEYIGQVRVKNSLDIAIEAARTQQRPLGHVFLAAPAGSGKTTLAALIAAKLGDPFEALSMAEVTPTAFAAHFRCHEGGVVLLDEVHAASRKVQEQMNTLLEEHYLTSPGGYRIEVGTWVTIVAATTEPEKVARAVRQKFELTPRFEPYTTDEMRRIVLQFARKVPQGPDQPVGITMSDDVAAALGTAAGGGPRNARHLVLKARDLQVRLGRPATAEEILSIAGVDPDGLTDDHLDYLRVLDRQQGMAGISTLQMILGMHESELREAERLLLERGLIRYGNRGRELTTPGAQRIRPDRVMLRRSA